MELKWIPVRGFSKTYVDDKGEDVIFSLILGEKTAATPEIANFKISHTIMPQFIGALMGIARDAEKVRAKNPLHADKVVEGYAFDYVSSGIGESQIKGKHIIQFNLQSPDGDTTYPIAFDRLGLEKLADLIRRHLDGENPHGQIQRH